MADQDPDTGQTEAGAPLAEASDEDPPEEVSGLEPSEESPTIEPSVDTSALPAESSPSSTNTSSPDTTDTAAGGDDSGNTGNTSNSNGNQFYVVFETIQKNVEALNAATKVIEKCNDRFLFLASTISSEEENALMRQVSSLVSATNIRARDTSRLIKQLRYEATKLTGEDADVDSSSGSGGGSSRIKPETGKTQVQKEEESRDASDRENICKNITRSFTDELLLYQSAVQDIKNELKERLTKKVQSIKPKASEDFIDLSLRSETSRFALFREIMSTDEKDLSETDAKIMKDDIAEKYVTISGLANCTQEMNKIFLDLASSNTQPDSDDDEDKKKPGTSADYDPLFGPRRGSTGTSRGPPSPKQVIHDKQRERHRNRVLAFLSRHNKSSVGLDDPSTGTGSSNRYAYGGAGKPLRRGRARRWVALFLLATVAIAALCGLVMLH